MNKPKIRIVKSKKKQHTFKPYGWDILPIYNFDDFDEIEIAILDIEIIFY